MFKFKGVLINNKILVDAKVAHGDWTSLDKFFDIIIGMDIIKKGTLYIDNSDFYLNF
ncbi:MAG: hypothetical protein FWE37_08840 [Spirochaetaceae bacterium]|nr:hypothetical protein [Spirochaetaceae bacterium]